MRPSLKKAGMKAREIGSRAHGFAIIEKTIFKDSRNHGSGLLRAHWDTIWVPIAYRLGIRHKRKRKRKK